MASFQKDELKKAEEYFKDVHMTQEQHKIFTDFVQIFLKYIPLEEITAKGIGWKAVKEWQLKHKRDLLGLIEAEPEERINSIFELTQIVKQDLIDILENPDDKGKIDLAIEELMDFYKDKYAFR